MKQHKKYEKLFLSTRNGEQVRFVKTKHGKYVRIRSDTKIGAPAFMREYRLAFSRNTRLSGASEAIEDLLDSILKRARQRSYLKSVPFNLRLSDVREMWSSQEGRCKISGLAMSIDNRPTQPSLDRVTPSKGYTQKNVRLVCWAVNAGMNDFGDEWYIEICRAVAENNPGPQSAHSLKTSAH